MIFNDQNIEDGETLYLCEYIPRSRSEYRDKRSDDLVIAYKNNLKYAINTVFENIKNNIGSDFAIAVIPSSKQSCNYMSPSHELAAMIVDSLKQNNITDASECLYRTHDIPAAHMQKGKRNADVLYESLEVRFPQLINGKDVLIIDDITTSGNSFITAAKLLKISGAKKIVNFAIGKTISNDNLKTGFIIDLDNTLFYTDSVKKLRDNGMWSDVMKEAKNIEPVLGAQELIDRIESHPSLYDYRIVTSSPRQYAELLCSKLNIPHNKIIAYNDTIKHKPDKEPYIKAKQQMMIYEPCIIAIGDNIKTDMQPAKKMDFTAVLISDYIKNEADNCFNKDYDLLYNTLGEMYRNFNKITQKAKSIQKLLKKD